MPEENKKYLVFPGMDDINKMSVEELTKLKIEVQKLEMLLVRKIRSIIQR